MRSFKKEQENQTQEKTTAEDLMKQMANAYDGRSTADIWKNILAQAEKGKREGTLSNEEIDRFYQTFSPMLSSAQRRKLEAVVEKLKKLNSTMYAFISILLRRKAGCRFPFPC